MALLSSIFTDKSLDPSNEWSTFLHARRCLIQFGSNNKDSNDLHDLKAMHGYHDLLSKANKMSFLLASSFVIKKHSQKQKKFAQRIVVLKNQENRALIDLIQFISSINAVVDSEKALSLMGSINNMIRCNNNGRPHKISYTDTPLLFKDSGYPINTPKNRLKNRLCALDAISQEIFVQRCLSVLHDLEYSLTHTNTGHMTQLEKSWDRQDYQISLQKHLKNRKTDKQFICYAQSVGEELISQKSLLLAKPIIRP